MAARPAAIRSGCLGGAIAAAGRRLALVDGILEPHAGDAVVVGDRPATGSRACGVIAEPMPARRTATCGGTSGTATSASRTGSRLLMPSVSRSVNSSVVSWHSGANSQREAHAVGRQVLRLAAPAARGGLLLRRENRSARGPAPCSPGRAASAACPWESASRRSPASGVLAGAPCRPGSGSRASFPTSVGLLTTSIRRSRTRVVAADHVECDRGQHAAEGVRVFLAALLAPDGRRPAGSSCAGRGPRPRSGSGSRPARAPTRHARVSARTTTSKSAAAGHLDRARSRSRRRSSCVLPRPEFVGQGQGPPCPDAHGVGPATAKAATAAHQQHGRDQAPPQRDRS